MYTPMKGERGGYVCVVALLATAALVGMAALTVDFGMLVASRQKVQSTVDAAALAGAQHLPGQGEANYWATECLQANNDRAMHLRMNASHDGDIICYHGGDTIPGYGVLGPDIDAIKVRSRGLFDYTFAKAFGWQTGVVTCSATAIGKDTSGWGMLFVEDVLTDDNATVEITAAVHSNNEMIFDGAEGFVDGDTSYVNSMVKDRCNIDFMGAQQQVPIQPRPTNCTAEDFSVDYDIIAGHNPPMVGAYRWGQDIIARGQVEVDFPPGVYECDDLVIRNCGAVTGEDVTFLVHGRVIFDNNESIQISSAQHDMAFYLTDDDEQALELDNGGPIEITGGVCVPNGGIYFDHSELRVTNGVMYCDSLEFDRCGTIFNTIDDGTSESFVKLIQ